MRAPSLLRSASPLIAGRAVSAVITFFLPVVLARRFAPDDYGTYKQFFLVASTLFLMGQIGLPASLYYFLPRSGKEKGRYLVQTLLGLAILGAAAAGVVLLAAPQLAYRFDNPTLAALAPALALYVAFTLAAAPLELSLTASGRTGWAAVAYVMSDLTRTALLLGPILSGHGLEALAWGAAGFGALRLIAAWTLALRGAIGAPAGPTRATVRAQLAYALPFAGAVLLSVAQMQLPQYVVAALTTTAVYAVYTVGILQLPITEMLYSPIAEVMMVRLASATPAEAPAIFREAMSRLAMFFFPLAAFLWAIGPVLIPTLYTAQYAAAVPIFLICSGEVLLSMIPVDGLLRSQGATRTLFLIGFVRLGFAAVLVPSLLILFGLPGAVIGYLATQLLAKTLLVRAAAARLGVPARTLFPAAPLMLWAGRAAVVFGGITALRLAGPWHGWAFLIVASMAGGIGWLAFVAADRFLPGVLARVRVKAGTTLG